jgi:uncharacterized protein
MRRLSAILAALLIVAGPVASQEAYPEPQGHVNDFAGVLPQGEVVRLEGLARRIRQATGIEIAFVTMDTLPRGQDISLYAVQLGHAWGVGGAEEDRGALLFYKTGQSDGERRIYLATGYGLEGDIPDARAGRILDQVTIPLLRERRNYEAFAATAAAIVSIVAPDARIEGMAADSRIRSQGEGEIPVAGLVVMLILFALLMSTGFGRSIFFGLLLGSMLGGRGGGWGGGGFGGGGFGGGFGGFGGGGFGGGGAGRSF